MPVKYSSYYYLGTKKLAKVTHEHCRIPDIFQAKISHLMNIFECVWEYMDNPMMLTKAEASFKYHSDMIENPPAN